MSGGATLGPTLGPTPGPTLGPTPGPTKGQADPTPEDSPSGFSSASERPDGKSRRPPPASALLLTVLVIGTCGLIYELLAGTLASYVLGDSVTQFSTVIGVYLFAMGIGAWMSGFIGRDVAARFVEIEIALSLIGGTSAAVLFIAFAEVSWFRLVLYGMVLVIGTLVGLEIPLLMRILKDRYELKDLVSRVLTFDYLGALLASLAFPLLLVPKLGLVRGSFVVGLLNAAVGIWCTYLLRDALRRPRALVFLRVEGFLTVAILLAGLAASDALTSFAEDRLYAEPIVYAKTTPYQRIVVTRGRGGFQLYLNGNLQLSSLDEHRYHEALVHPAFAARAEPGESLRVLVLGGGDGLAVREVLKVPGVRRVTLVDLDPAMTELARRHPLFSTQNERALDDPRVEVVNADAMVWLHERQAGGPLPASARYDVIVVDFPDPNTFALGKLYTSRFYRLVATALARGGIMAVQATSPMYARRSFWCIRDTLEAAGWSAVPYHVAVPSFGEWGFFLAARSGSSLSPPTALVHGLDRRTLRYLTDETLRAAFAFPADMAEERVGENRLDNQILVRIYEDEWARWH